jgi:hypothetical protein
MEAKMSVRCRSAVVALVLILSPFVALRHAEAVGPDYQYIPDAPVGGGLQFGALSSPTLNDIADIGTTGNSAGESGTGTVIGYATQGNTTYLSVLTALHVMLAATTPTNVYFGSGFSGTAPVLSRTNGSITGPTNSGFLLQGTITTNAGKPLMSTYTLPGQAAPEDMAVVQVTINQAQATASPFAAAELKLITAPGDIPALGSSFAGAAGAYGTPVGYTQYGYGLTGIWNATNPNVGGGATVIPANTYTAYNQTAGVNTQDASAYRRFQNNQETSLAAPAPFTYGGNNYFQPITKGNTTAPGTAGGAVTGAGGTGFGGDSGGPLMTSTAGEQVFVTPNIFAAANNVPTLVPVNDTDTDSAVYVGLRTPILTVSDGAKTIGQSNYTAAPGPTTLSAVPLLTADQTNALTGAAPPMPGMPSPNYVLPGMGSLDWASQYMTDGTLFNGIMVNGANGGPLAIPEPATLSILAFGGIALLGRRRNKRRSVRVPAILALAGAALTLGRPVASQAQYVFPTVGNTNQLNSNFNSYVAQQQSQFSGAASALMMLNSTTVGVNPGSQSTVQTTIAKNNLTAPSGVFASDAFGIRASLAAADGAHTYTAYAGFTQATTNSANLTLAYNITHYKVPGSILATQMNPVTNTMAYSWMDVYGVSSSVLPPAPGSPAPCTVFAYFVRDPWVGYWQGAGNAVQAITPPGLGGPNAGVNTGAAAPRNALLGNNKNGLWSQIFQPYNPRAIAQPAGTITMVPASTFGAAGPTTAGKYQFVTDPDEDDTTFDTVDESAGSAANTASSAISDANNDLAGTSDPGADTTLATLPEFQGGSFQTTGDADISLPGSPGDSEWVLGYYPTGSSGPTGAVVIDQQTGDVSGAFWNDDGTTLSLPSLDGELTDVADGFDPMGSFLTSALISVPEPGTLSLLALGGLALLRRRAR